MRRMRPRRWLGSGLGLALVALLGSAGSGPASAAPASLAPRCPTDQLRVTFAGVPGGLSHAGTEIRFTNRGPRCRLGGYPGVDALSGAGRRLLSAQRSRTGYLGGVSRGPIPTLGLSTGQTGSALLQWVHGPIPGLACDHRIRDFEITPPGNRTSIRTTAFSSPTPICDLVIGPVLPGRRGAAGT